MIYQRFFTIYLLITITIIRDKIHKMNMNLLISLILILNDLNQQDKIEPKFSHTET